MRECLNIFVDVPDEGFSMWPIRGWLAKARLPPPGIEDMNAKECLTNDPHEQTHNQRRLFLTFSYRARGSNPGQLEIMM